MTQLPMYPGQVNSPEVFLTISHDAATPTIWITGDVPNKLPAAPNMFTIGTGEDAEGIYYPTDGVSLGGGNYRFDTVTRHFQGSSKAWDINTPVYRQYTTYDQNTFRSNILDLSSTKADASSVTVKGLPTYDAIVYQDVTTTYAYRRDGTLITSCLISAKTDNIPIQAAIVYLEGLSADLSQGYSLYINSGVYYIAAELVVTKPHHISGAGQQITVLRSAQSPVGLATFSVIPDTNIDDDGWQRGGFTLRNITLDGSTDGGNSTWWGTYGVYFGGSINWVVYGAVMCHFENVTFRNFTKYGSYDNSNWGSMYLHCSFIRNGGPMSANSTNANIAMMSTGGLALFGNAHNVIGCNFYSNSNGICVRGGNLSNFDGNISEGNWLNGVLICNVVPTYPYTVGTVTSTTRFVCAGLHGIAHANDYIFVNGRSGSIITSFDDGTHEVILTTPITGLTSGDTFYFTPYRMDTPWDYGGPDMSTWNNTWVEANGSYNDAYPGDMVQLYDMNLYTGSRHSVRNTNSVNSTGATNSLLSNGNNTVIENYADHAGKGISNLGSNPKVENFYSAGTPVKGYSYGYSINVQALTSSPADGATIYFGSLPKAPTTTANISKVYIRNPGRINRAEIYCYSGTAGTSESWSLYIRKNNTTDYLIATISAATNERVFSNSAMDIPVVAGDYIEIKGVQPTWATNPATTIYGGYIHIE